MAPPEVASGDMPNSMVDSPIIEGSLAKTIVAGVTSHMETVPAVTVNTGVTTAATLAPLGNDCKNLVVNFIQHCAFFL